MSGHSGSGKRDSDIPHPLAPTDGQHEAFRSGDRDKENRRYRFLRVASARLTAERKKWRCPNCRRRYRVLIDHDPELCPECSEHCPSPAATPEKSKILMERDDPFVEFLSRLTGHRFSHVSLLKSAIAVAIVIALSVTITLSVIQFVRQEPLSAVDRHDIAEAERRTEDVGDLLTTLTRTVPATQLKRESDASKTPAPGGFVNDGRPPAPHNSPHTAPQAAAILGPPIAAAVAVKPGNSKEHGEQSAKDGELIAVRGWLKEHQDDPDWDEVKWWPSKPVDEDLVTYGGLLKSDRVARLKYRFADQDGTLTSSSFEKTRCVPCPAGTIGGGTNGEDGPA
jgi:hypothetical protein